MVGMIDHVEVQCPWCGEWLELDLEADVHGDLVQDCEVCCRPIQVRVTRDRWGDPDVRVERAG
ncbi:MAG: CPXCG motif-containing cysteine-rich protein [Acidobacteriota bacterium]